MNLFRIALANIRRPATPEESVTLAQQAIAQASIERAGLIGFPECFVPGYRVGKPDPPPAARRGSEAASAFPSWDRSRALPAWQSAGGLRLSHCASPWFNLMIHGRMPMNTKKDIDETSNRPSRST
jgi:hypothetical protein